MFKSGSTGVENEHLVPHYMLLCAQYMVLFAHYMVLCAQYMILFAHYVVLHAHYICYINSIWRYTPSLWCCLSTIRYCVEVLHVIEYLKKCITFYTRKSVLLCVHTICIWFWAHTTSMCCTNISPIMRHTVSNAGNELLQPVTSYVKHSAILKRKNRAGHRRKCWFCPRKVQSLKCSIYV